MVPTAPPEANRRQPRHPARHAGGFRRVWLDRKQQLSAGAAMLYLLVHHLTSLNAGKSRWVKLTQEALRRFGLSRKHKDKWLAPLAEASLIAVKRRDRTSKRAIEVRLLPRVREPDGADEHSTH
jgi:hypothetical protein